MAKKYSPRAVKNTGYYVISCPNELDGLPLYKPGAYFQKQQFNVTLSLGYWPMAMRVVDVETDIEWTVIGCALIDDNGKVMMAKRSTSSIGILVEMEL